MNELVWHDFEQNQAKNKACLEFVSGDLFTKANFQEKFKHWRAALVEIEVV